MIKCRALEEKSLYVTANGDILPCCFMHHGGPDLTPELREIVKDENFSNLTKSWETTPFHTCHVTCDDGTTDNPLNMNNFEGQWKNNQQDDTR